MKTREEEITQKAKEIASNWDDGRGNVFYHRVDMLCNMAHWADEHPISGEQIAAMKNEIKFLKRKLVECDKMYRELQNENPWRDAKKELPKEGERVFVRYEWERDHPNFEYETIIDCDYIRAIYVGDNCWKVEENDFFNDYNTVTHWMPIPELKGGEV